MIYFNVGFYLNEEGSHNQRFEIKGVSTLFWNLYINKELTLLFLILLIWLLCRSFVIQVYRLDLWF